MSGLYASLLLARGGHGVKVLEEGEGPLPPRRLIVTQALREEFPDLVPRVLYEVRAYKFVGPGSEAIIPLRASDLVVERRDLAQLLLSMCREVGVEVLWGRSFSALRDGEVLFRGPTGEGVLAADRVIAADGARSRVRRAFGEALPLVYLRQAKVKRPKGFEDGVSVIWFRPELTPYFLWFFQDSPDTGVLGLIAPSRAEGQKALEEFLGHGPWEASGFEEGWVSLYRPGLRPQAGRVLFLGDAAGHVKNSTVGGAVAGLRAASACARAILRGTDYPRELGPLTRELWVHYVVRRILSGLTGHDYDRIIRALEEPKGLGSLSRDRLLRDLPLFLLKNGALAARLTSLVGRRVLSSLWGLTGKGGEGNHL